MLLALVAIVLTLLLVVGIHEAGHALAARYFQVKIKKISIGFGTPLLRWQSGNGCEWVWAMFPLGGYVQLENTRISPVEPKDYPYCFDKKPIWQRVVILLAGAVANLLTAWLALVFVFILGLTYTVPEVQTVQADSLAAKTGIVAGNRFVSIAGKPTLTWNDVGMELVILWGKKEVPVILSQGEKLKKVNLDLSQVTFHSLKRNLLAQLGMTANLSAPRAQLHSVSFVEAMQQSIQTIGHMLYFFIMILKQLFFGLLPFSLLLGPLGIFVASVASLTQGMAVFLFFIASFSLAVALVNLFPIPGLDGGSIVYVLLEAIRGKPISVAMELLLYRLAFILFCMILVHLLMNDLQRY